MGQIETKRERRQRESRDSGPSDDTLYQKIHESFLKEDYATAQKLSREYLTHGRNKPNTEDVLYLESLSLLKLGRAEEARRKLGELEKALSPNARRASPRASVADSYYYEGNLELAYKSYEETLTRYPQSDQTPYVLARLLELSKKKEDPLLTAAPLRQMALEEHRFYTVQVGSFSQHRNAQSLLNKLLHYQYDAYLEKDDSGRRYRVRIGKFSSREEASTLETRLKKEGYSTKIYP